MKITNISQKIIGVGTTVLMPDAAAEIDDKVVKTPAVKALVEMGFLKADAPVEFEPIEADLDTSSVTLVMADEPEEEKVEKKPKAAKNKKTKSE